MWEGLTGTRLKNGSKGLIVGIIVSSILLFSSFYVYFLYLLIPIILVVIFHYSKSWRYSDRAFYGFIAILIAFFIAVSGISYTIMTAPPHSEVIYQLNGSSYDINFSYSNVQSDYSIYITLPAKNISTNASLSLISLFSGSILANYSIVMSKNGSLYQFSKNLGHLSGDAYVLNFTFFNELNNTLSKHSVEFLGPILVPIYTVILEFGKSLLITYLLITYIFYLVFAYFARMIGNTRKRITRPKDNKENKKNEEEITQNNENEKKEN